MLGLALGDGLGRIFEGRGEVGIEEIFAAAREAPLLRYTDDTQMSIGVAESLISRGGFDGEDMARRFLRNYDPSRGYGWGTSRVLATMREGVNWRSASRSLFGGEGSYGNGAAMRIAPMGLLYYDRVEDLIQIARLSSLITHSHPLGVAGAVTQALSISAAVKANSEEDLDIQDFIDTLQREVKSRIFGMKFQIARECLDGDPSKREIRMKLGNGVEAFNSVPTAIYIFIKHRESFEGAVLHAISLGGDTDTIGSMVGALSGSYLGMDELPEGWVGKLEDAEYIRDLAERLWKLREDSDGGTSK